MSATWIDVCSLTDIPPLGAQRLRVGEVTIGLFRAANDQVFAIEDACPHKQGPLSQGIVHGSCVTCPLHNWVIDLASGEAQGADEGAVETFDTKLTDGGLVQVLVPDALFARQAA